MNWQDAGLGPMVSIVDVVGRAHACSLALRPAGLATPRNPCKGNALCGIVCDNLDSPCAGTSDASASLLVRARFDQTRRRRSINRVRTDRQAATKPPITSQGRLRPHGAGSAPRAYRAVDQN